jgi:glyoxylase-like metal-dependent hydrolase (beta-lactamase superfamily II)
MIPEQGKRAAVPASGEFFEVRPGILWTRLDLPFRLNHVNIYVFDDDGGWTIFDTGIGDAVTQAAWQQMLGGRLAGRPVRRIICSHHHPDHVGMVGWLAQQTGAPLHISETEYLLAEYYASNPEAIDGDVFRRLYLGHGVSAEMTEDLLSRGHNYQRITTGVPDTFVALRSGASLTIGGRRFEVMTGGGHSSDQAMLFCADESLFVAADQVLPRITPNIGISGMQPDADPLGHYLISLTAIQRAVPDSALVLPGHDWPFDNLHERIRSLIAHHGERCDMIVAACRRDGWRTAGDLVSVLFPQVLDLHQRSFAFAETVAHVNYLLGTGQLVCEQSCGIRRVAA